MDAGRVSPGDGPVVGGPGDGWSSFEIRMRQRRAVRVLERARTAIEQGCETDARDALAEARLLIGEAAEITQLEARLHVEHATVPLPPDLPVAEADPGSAGRSIGRQALFAAAALILAGGGLAYGARYWRSEPPVRTSTAAAPAPAAVPAATSGVTSTAAGPRKLTVVQDLVTAQVAAPRIVEDAMPPLPSYPGPPVAAPDPEPEPVVLAVNRTPPEPPAPPVDSRPDLPVRSEPPPSAPAPPAVRASLPDPAPVATLKPDPPPRTEAPGARIEAGAPSAPVRDEAVVRSVLQRYEAAYSNLDASAASAVWPGVDRGALARAFDGLASQNVSLGSCDVDVKGQAARATCSGSATWRPKVGGGSHTEGRRWNFELRKAGDNWRIERAVIR